MTCACSVLYLLPVDEYKCTGSSHPSIAVSSCVSAWPCSPVGCSGYLLSNTYYYYPRTRYLVPASRFVCITLRVRIRPGTNDAKKV